MEMNGLMNSVSIQIQRAISEAINVQVLPQVQASLCLISGKCHKRDGTFRSRDQNTGPKEPLIARSEVVQEMRFSEADFVKKMKRSLMTLEFLVLSFLVLFILCFLNYPSDVITASQIAR